MVELFTYEMLYRFLPRDNLSNGFKVVLIGDSKKTVLFTRAVQI